MQTLHRFSLAPFLLCTIAVLSLYAQAPDTLWTRTYGGSDWDEGYSILETSDGSYVVLGGTASFGPNYDISLIKIDSSGDTLWTRLYSTSGSETGYCINETSDGGYIITGWTDWIDFNGDCYLVKINSNGDTVWTRTYGGAGYDEGYVGSETADGGYIIAGYTDSYGVGGDMYIIKTDASGDSLWTRYYGRDEWDFAADIKEIVGVGYVVAGMTESFGPSLDDAYLLKLNQDGDTIWTKTYGRANCVDWALSVELLSDGGYILAGWTVPYTYVNSNAYFIRTDINGDTVWTRTYDDFARCVQVINDSNYVATGFTYSYGAGECDVYLLKVTSTGNLIWETAFGGSTFDAGASIIQTSDGGYVITGYTDSYGVGGDIYVIRTEPDVSIREQSIAKPIGKNALLNATQWI